MKNTFSDSMVRVALSQCRPGHLVLDLRLPWYRSLPLSVVEFAALDVNGQAVPLAGATLVLEGRTHDLSAMPGLTMVQWFVQDSAYLHLDWPGFDTAARPDVGLLMKLYPPYIPMLVWVTRGTTPQETTA